MTDHSDLPFKKALPWLLFITALFFLNFVCRSIFSPLMPTIEADLGITHARAGRFFLDISIGYSVVLLLSGVISSRISHRWCIGLAAVWMGTGMLIVAFSTSGLVMEAGLVWTGMGGGLYLPSGIAALTSLVKDRDYGKALSVHELAPNLSLCLSPLIAQAFLAWADWRANVAMLGLVSIVLGLVFVRYGRGGEARGQFPGFRLARNMVRSATFWVLLCLFCLAIGASMGPYSMLPLFLVDERGMSKGLANALLSLSRVSGPFVAFAAGWASDRWGIRLTIGAFLVLVGGTTILLGLATGPLLVAAVLLQPAFVVCFFPAGFTAISRAFPASQRSMAISLIIPCGILTGLGIIPALLGFMGDHGAFGLGFVLLGAVLLAALALLRLLPEPARP